MNPKKLFSVIFGIVFIIVVYNFVLPYFMLQNTNGMRMGMGMGMHGGERISSNNLYFFNLIPNFIIILGIVFLGFIFLNKVLFSSNTPKCKNCGLTIESKQWKICPRCGHHLNDKGGENS